MDERFQKLDSLLRTYTERETEHLNGIIRGMDGYHSPYDSRRHAYQLIMTENTDHLHARKHHRFSVTQPHYHNFIEISYMYDGSLMQTINGNDVLLKKGDLTLVDSNTVHSYARPEENDLLVNIVVPKKILTMDAVTKYASDNPLTQFLFNAARKDNTQINYLVFNILSAPRLQSFLTEFLYEEFFPSPMHEQIMRNLFSLIITDMMNVINTERVAEQLGRSNTIVYHALSYIEENYLSCSLEDTADAVGVNPAYLTTLIKSQTGESCMDIIIKKRMRYAADLLLTTDQSIEQIVDTCGYRNMTYFYKKFKDMYQTSPRKYRENHRKT